MATHRVLASPSQLPSYLGQQPRTTGWWCNNMMLPQDHKEDTCLSTCSNTLELSPGAEGNRWSGPEALPDTSHSQITVTEPANLLSLVCSFKKPAQLSMWVVK